MMQENASLSSHSGSFSLSLVSPCIVRRGRKEPFEFCLGVYSALDYCLRNLLVSVYGIPVPLLCRCLSTPAICPRADFLAGDLFIVGHSLGTLWRALAGHSLFPLQPSLTCERHFPASPTSRALLAYFVIQSSLG